MPVICKDFASLARAAFNSGKPLVVRFTEKVDMTELCADAGWMAHVVGIAEETDNGRPSHGFTFDYSVFDAHNDRMASHNYYDRDHKPTLTAKESGHYRQRESWSFYDTEELPFEVVENEAGEELNRDARLAALEQKYAALEARLAEMERK